MGKPRKLPTTQQRRPQRQAQHPSEPLEPDPIVEYRAAARAAGLHYVTDHSPGIRRRRHGAGFTYRDSTGKVVRDPETLQRIRSLAIPPAWTQVWISPSAKGHIQATGRDAKGRKQYRYHPDWRTQRDETKFQRMLEFGNSLPAIREKTSRDLALSGLPKRKVLAAVVQLLEGTLIRIGNDSYAKNNSYGLTTFRDRHARIHGSQLSFHFRGKSGKYRRVHLESPKLARLVKRCRDLPGCDLFQYLNEEGQPESISSSDVNAYLNEISGKDFTAKEFRTWFGSVLAIIALQQVGDFHTESHSKKKIKEAVDAVAQTLGNTTTVCRNCYVHPGVVQAYLERDFFNRLARPTQRQKPQAPLTLSQAEQAFLRLLRAAERSNKIS